MYQPSQDSRRWLSAGIVLPSLVLFVYMLRGILSAVALGMLFAAVLTPWTDRLRKALGKRQRLAPFVMTTGSILVFFAPLIFIAVMAVQSGTKLLTTLRALPKSDIQSRLKQWGSMFDVITRRFSIDYDHNDLSEALADIGEKSFAWLGTSVGEFAAGAPNGMLDAMMFVLTMYFVLAEGHVLLRWVESLLPFDASDRDDMFKSLRETIYDVMLGSLLTGFVQATLVLISTFALSVPLAYLWFIVAFILSFIPLVGTLPITGGATLYLLVQGRVVPGIIMGICGVLIGLSDNIVRPLVSSRSGNMHPLLSLAAIFGGLNTFGAAGIFLGPLLAAFTLWGINLYAMRTTKKIAPEV